MDFDDDAQSLGSVPPSSSYRGQGELSRQEAAPAASTSYTASSQLDDAEYESYATSYQGGTTNGAPSSSYRAPTTAGNAGLGGVSSEFSYPVSDFQAGASTFADTSAGPDISGLGLDGDQTPKERRVESLMRMWRNERAAPELLEYQTDLIQDAEQRLLELKERVRLGKADSTGREDIHLSLMIVMAQNMRVAWVLKEYKRCRLQKIERFVLSLMMDMADAKRRLSPEELRYAEKYGKMWTDLMKASVTDHFHSRHRRLNEDSMITRPDLNQPVFIRVRRKCGPVFLPDGEQQLLEKDSQHMLRYTSIREYLRRGWVELL